MKTKTWTRRWMVESLGALAVGLTAALAWAGDEPAPPADASGSEETAEVTSTQTEYWIGLMGMPVDELLKMHLKIDGGLVVQNIVPDSPADKAGLQKNDVLIKFNETPIDGLETLTRAIRENEDSEATLSLIRAGKPKSLKIKPGPRPAEAVVAESLIPGGEVASSVLEILKKLEADRGGQDALSIWLWQPGVVQPKSPSERVQRLDDSNTSKPRWMTSLPPGTSITITKSDEGAVQIVVKRGEKGWTVDESKIDELPEDLRGPVRDLLQSGTRLMIRPGAVPRLRIPEVQLRELQPSQVRPKLQLKIQPAEPGGESSEEPREPGLNKRLDDLKRQLRESQLRLEHEIEKLRRDLESKSPTDS
ncbi:MAG: PDZ domain-containing protein [Planctomycetes bacterium]|nr:PDZ domain-containing protein [Planctomycetota bacterium]